MATQRVGGLDDPIWTTVNEPLAGKTAPDPRRTQIVIVAATIGSAIVLGYLGWTLPEVGAPLTYPTLIVLGTGLGIGAIGWAIGERRHLGARRALVFPLIAGLLAVAAATWTFEFSLPASVAWFSDATQQAQNALFVAAHGPKDRWGEPVQDCAVVTSGAVGPISAPYEVCTSLSPATVRFFAMGSQSGIEFVSHAQNSNYFPDACSRQLSGSWWMYRSSNNGVGGCPIGYRFHGGG